MDAQQPKPKRNREYTDAQKAAALAALDANQGNIKRTSAQCGIPRQTLQSWTNQDRKIEVEKLRVKKRGDLAEKMEFFLMAALEVLPARIKQASFRDLATGIGIVSDKLAYIKGLDNARSSSSQPVLEAEQRLEQIIKAAEKRIADEPGAGPDRPAVDSDDAAESMGDRIPEGTLVDETLQPTVSPSANGTPGPDAP